MPDTPRPMITAVVATRDRLAMLRTAVNAIVAQDYAGVVQTIVVIDGGATPEGLASDDARRPIRVMTNQRKQGLPGARNTGILASDGEFIAFCDDDDVWQPGKLEAQVSLLESRPDVLLVVTGMTVVWNERRIERVYPSTTLTLEDFVAHPSSFLWRREAFDLVGLVDEELPGAMGEDRDLLIRVARYSDIGNVTSSFVDVHWHPGTFFMDKWATVVEAIDYFLDKHPELVASPRGHSRFLGRRAFALAACGDRAGALASAMRSLRLWPGDRRAWTALVVASGLVSAERAQRLANSRGRGI